MPASHRLRDRDGTELAVLEALLDRGDEGMTVLELRARVDADIDELEQVLGDLKEDDLITVETDDDGRTLLKAAEDVTPTESESEQSFVEWLRERVGL